MTVLERIAEAAKREGLRFLVIGGFAVNFHGFSRTTGDIDLAVERTKRESWKTFMERLGYRITEENEFFLQFESRTLGSWPVDLMLANQKTFDGLWADSKEQSVGKSFMRSVSLDHLLALKLHVLKQAKLHRFQKDFLDVVSLISVNKLDIESDRYRQLFERYGSLKLHEQILRYLREP